MPNESKTLTQGEETRIANAAQANKESKAKEQSPQERVDVAVEEWFFEHVHNTAIAREGAAWEAAVKARDALKVKLLNSLF